jgi:5'-phosphate synthase pdxT subunit
MVVGVLALQGAFERHLDCLTLLGCEARIVKDKMSLKKCAGLVLPGGESTAMLKLLHYDEDFYSDLKLFVSQKPVYGTCAGAILLSRKVLDPEQESFGSIDIEIQRNAFGRQLDSFTTDCLIRNPEEECQQKKGFFIRAPRIVSVGSAVKPLLYYNDEVVAATEGRCLVSTFHPELTDDLGIYKYFLKYNF